MHKLNISLTIQGLAVEQKDVLTLELLKSLAKITH